MESVKLCTWNVNGLKSVLQKFGNLDKFLDALQSDIICIQETKLRVVNDSTLCISDGFFSYFACNQSHEKMGIAYSGVATFVRKDAGIDCIAAQIGLTGMLPGESPSSRPDGGIISLSEEELAAAGVTREEAMRVEMEGRAVITDHGAFVCINVYAPYAPMEDSIRFSFKLNFNALVQCAIAKLHASGRSVVLLGDLNVTASPLDHCDPCDFYYKSCPTEGGVDSAAVEDTTGPGTSTDTGTGTGTGEGTIAVALDTEIICVKFADKPHVRWINDLLTPVRDTHTGGGTEMSNYLIDSFRHMHPERAEAYTCWNTLTSARLTNYGTRIDYILLSHGLLSPPATSEYPPSVSHFTLIHSDICPEVMGSDHCPVTCTLAALPLRSESHGIEGAGSSGVSGVATRTDRESTQPPSLCTCHLPSFGRRQMSLADAFSSSTAASPAEHSTGLEADQTRKRPLSLAPGGTAGTAKNKNKKVSARQMQLKLNFGVPPSGHDATTICVDDAAKQWACTQCTFENTYSLKSSGSVKLTATTVTCVMCGLAQTPVPFRAPSNSDQNCATAGANGEDPCSLMPTPEAESGLGSDLTAAEVNAFNVLRQSQSPIEAPLCSGHNLPCLAHIVHKDGPNKGKRFFCCRLPVGKLNAPNARCAFFKWDENFRQMVKLKSDEKSKK